VKFLCNPIIIRTVAISVGRMELSVLTALANNFKSYHQKLLHYNTIVILSCRHIIIIIIYYRYVQSTVNTDDNNTIIENSIRHWLCCVLGTYIGLDRSIIIIIKIKYVFKFDRVYIEYYHFYLNFSLEAFHRNTLL